jgi:hypothetical protein
MWGNFCGATLLLVLSTRLKLFRTVHDRLGEGRGDFFTILLLAALFSLAVEIPGFCLNVGRDRKLVRAVGDVANELLDLRLDPAVGTGPLEASVDRFRGELSELDLLSLVERVAGTYKRMGNIDSGLVDRAISEVRAARSYVEGRSKHPAPTLVQILSVSGLGFVLCQILAVLRGN